MAQPAQVLLLADLDDALRVALESTCTAAGFPPLTESSAEVAITKLGARRFDALVLHLGTPGAALTCMKARGRLLRIRIPVLALVDDDDDAAFARAYRAGADDVLLTDRPELLALRLRALPRPSLPQPGAARGDAVVADADRNRAEVLERVLKDAGFRVEVAVDGFAARLQAGRPSLKVAVVDASLDEVPVLIAQVRAKGSRCAWVVRARPEHLDEMRAALRSVERTSVVSAYGPPDDVLFETNQLLEPRSEGRSDARLLHGTIVRIKWPTSGVTDVGYTYNVSSLGLYVRTLSPPREDTVELEVVPPGADAAVHLTAQVVWRREFGTTRKEPVPAGFGVRITGGAIDAWAAACPQAASIRPRMLSEPPRDSAPRMPMPMPMPAVQVRDGRKPAHRTLMGTGPEPPPDKGREPFSSVEQMLASVLDAGPPEPHSGNAPLSIDGDSVIEVERLSAAPQPADPDGDRVTVVGAHLSPSELPAEPSAPEPPPAAPRPATDDMSLAPTFFPAARESSPPKIESIPPEEITAESLGFDIPEEPPAPSSHAPPPAPSARRSLAAARVEAPAPEPIEAHPSVPPDDGPTRADTPVAKKTPDMASSSAPPDYRPSSGASDSLHVPTSKTPGWVWAVLLAVVAGGAAALIVGTAKGPPNATKAAGSAARPATKVVLVPPSPSPSPAVPEPAASAAPEPAASVAPEPAASAAPPEPAASAAPEPEPPAGGDEPPDQAALLKLPPQSGYLYVASTIQTNVYVYGHEVGRTNQRIVSKCGPRFLRLGTAPGAWQGEGVVHIVKCGGYTRVAMTGK